MSIKLVSINIERDKHLNRVIPFIQGERPDILCLQELNEKDVPLFVETMRSKYHRFTPMLRHTKETGRLAVGVGIFSRFPVAVFQEHYYVGRREEIPEID
ncbi:MAG TPA: endonuclease/exonuclease/phosphatase family protein, partial [Candidatus Paceibacterota bacterium]